MGSMTTVSYTHLYKAPTDYIYFEENNISLQLGRRVRLRSDEYFKEGYRDSRVISISRKINNPQEMEIGCSLATSVGRLSPVSYTHLDVYKRQR